MGNIVLKEMSDNAKEIWDYMEKEKLNPVKMYDAYGNLKSIGISCRYDDADVDVSIVPDICYTDRDERLVYLVNVLDFHFHYCEETWLPHPYYWDIEQFIEECSYHKYRERMEKELQEEG